MNIADYFKILHTPKEVGKFVDFILRGCCAEDKFISENNGSFSFDAYIGCSNRCAYCYMNRDPYNKFIDNKSPKIKKALVDIESGRKQIITEINANLQELRNHGLMTSFVSDPFLPEIQAITIFLIDICCEKRIPLRVLTKRTDWVYNVDLESKHAWKEYISFGYTLTNVDKAESNASPNADRIKVLLYLSKLGYNTFCSIEPIIDSEESYAAIYDTFGKCSYYKIGTDAMRKYDSVKMKMFVEKLILLYQNYVIDNNDIRLYPTVYLKENVLDAAGIAEEDFPDFVKNITSQSDIVTACS